MELKKHTQVSQKIEKFFSAFHLKEAGSGQILIQAGEEPGRIIQLATGQVRQYTISDQGTESVVNVFKPPAFFPMSWAINKTPNDYFFEASGAITYYEAPPDKVVAFLHDNQDVVFDLLSRVYTGVDGILARMTHLMSGNARKRLVFELCIQFRRFGVVTTGDQRVLMMNEDELASRAGLSRETVSRELAKLKKGGLITISRKKITVTDLVALENLLTEQPF